jgi:predicted nucleotidyltransferase
VTDSPSPPLVEALVAALEAAPEIQEAYLFGSQATGTATAISDVDVAVCIDRASAPAASAYGYAADLAVRLGRALGRDDVEVVVLNDAPPLLYHRAITRGVRIFSRDLRATTTREGRALSRYCDYVPQLRRIDAALRARLAAGTFGR